MQDSKMLELLLFFYGSSFFELEVEDKVCSNLYVTKDNKIKLFE